MMANCPSPRFTMQDVIRASDEWGANCGPVALALVAGMTLDEVRVHLGDFEQKRYTNPTLMLDSLRRVGLHRKRMLPKGEFPEFGLARVQWEGPWTAPGVPIRVRYRHTHWIASYKKQLIFDVNCMSCGGWVPFQEWNDHVVPWLLNQCEPKANGLWHLTHSIEIEVRP